MSSTATHITVSETSVPAREASPRRIRFVDQELVHALALELESTVDEDERVDVRSSQPRRHVLTGPIVVDVDEDDCYIAADLTGAVYGAGASESEALSDYYRALDEHLHFLRSHVAELHPRLERQFAALERLFPDR